MHLSLHGSDCAAARALATNQNSTPPACVTHWVAPAGGEYMR